MIDPNKKEQPIIEIYTQEFNQIDEGQLDINDPRVWGARLQELEALKKQLPDEVYQAKLKEILDNL